MIIEVENIKTSIKIPQELISQFSVVTGCAVTKQRSTVFLHSRNKNWKMKFKSTIPFTISRNE